jgi:hypothetical protein
LYYPFVAVDAKVVCDFLSNSAGLFVAIIPGVPELEVFDY